MTLHHHRIRGLHIKSSPNLRVRLPVGNALGVQILRKAHKYEYNANSKNTISIFGLYAFCENCVESSINSPKPRAETMIIDAPEVKS